MSEKIDDKALRSPVNRGPVRITIPASVAYDLGSLKTSFASLAERLGCSTCFSGADCRFQMERDFVINEKLAVAAAPGAQELARRDPSPHPWKSGYDVHLPKEVSYDIKAIHGAIEKIVGVLGCKACCSGFDLFFRQELDVLAIDKNLNVQRFG